MSDKPDGRPNCDICGAKVAKNHRCTGAAHRNHHAKIWAEQNQQVREGKLTIPCPKCGRERPAQEYIRTEDGGFFHQRGCRDCRAA